MLKGSSGEKIRSIRVKSHTNIKNCGCYTFLFDDLFIIALPGQGMATTSAQEQGKAGREQGKAGREMGKVE